MAHLPFDGSWDYPDVSTAYGHGLIDEVSGFDLPKRAETLEPRNRKITAEQFVEIIANSESWDDYKNKIKRATSQSF